MRFLVVFFLLASSAASAAERPVYTGLVARAPGLDGVRLRLDKALATAFEKQGASAVIPEPAAETQGTESTEELRRLLEDARSRYAEADFEAALIRCEDGIARFESRLAFTDNKEAWGLYLELMMSRAMSLLRLGRERPAAATLSALAAQRADFVPDPSWVPPKVIERLDAARKLVREMPAGTLKLSSRPGGAAVVVDGIERGATPLKLDTLLPGPHYVSFTRGKRRAEEYIVLKAEDRSVNVELGDLRTDAARALLAALKEKTTEDKLGNLASSIGPVVVTGVIEPGDGEVSVLLARIEGGAIAAVSATTLSDDLGDLDARVGAISRAILSAEGDAWADGMEGPDLRYRLLGAPPSPRPVISDEAEDGSGLWLAGLGLGGALVAAAVVSGAAVTAVVFYLNQPQNPGGTDVVVDTSGLGASP